MQKIKTLFNHTTKYTNENDLPVNFEDAYEFHKSMKEYETTPLHNLSSLADLLHVKGVYVKDESYRFGLNAFKGLGASYALNEIIKNDPQADYTFVSCTDGNHGKALAWRANMLGYNAIIFMPKGSEKRRVKAIEQHHAKVFVTEMNYADTVRYASEYAKEHDYYLVQDMALPDCKEIPNNIVLGYSTMIHEALRQLPEKATHVFLQAGVGAMAGGVVWYLYNKLADELPFIGIIEADSVACIYESVEQNRIVSIGGDQHTVMAGLNCGEANSTTFPLLKARANCFIKCKDEVTVKGMVRAKTPVGNDPAFSSGESGAVGLGFIEEILSDSKYSSLKEQLNLDDDSVVLVFSTEGEIKDE